MSRSKPRSYLILALALSLITTGNALGAAKDDPLRHLQWGLDRIGVPDAWEMSKGKGATIAILDAGVDLTHPEFAKRMVVLPGADFADPQDVDGPQDTSGHGTALAGIAAAGRGNGIGLAGVAPEAKIMPVRIFSETSFTVDEIAEGIKLAADNGADVILMAFQVNAFPWAVESAFPTEPFARGDLKAVEAAAAYAWEKGVFLVGPSGNGFAAEGRHTSALPGCAFPGGLPHVLCVGGIDRNDRLPYYSNFEAERLDVVAPTGADTSEGPLGAVIPCEDRTVTTFLPGGPRGCPGGLEDGYSFISGTSSASAFATGVAALLAAEGLTNEQILDALVSTAEDVGAPGKDPLFGAGIIDAAAALEAFGR